MFEEFTRRTEQKFEVLTEAREFIDNEFLAGKSRLEIDSNVSLMVKRISNQYDRLSASATIANYMRDKFKGE